MDLNGMTLVSTAMVATLLAGGIAIFMHGRGLIQRIAVFSLLCGAGAVCIGAGLVVLLHPVIITAGFPLGLPWLNWHLRLDVLSAFFFILLGVVLLPMSIYGYGYCREYEHVPLRLTPLLIFTTLALFGMQLVLVSDDAFAFMIGWELMSLSSYFLVAFHHERPETMRAAFLYLLIAHIGALAILLGFGVLAGFGDSFAFSTMRATTLSPLWASVAFALTLLGFGTKAGLVPMHLWLPEAHPVAPSYVSAMMSAVVVKMAVYGFIRVSFDLLGTVQWSWGVAVLLVGAITALYGVLNALSQHELKRLLAYSTVENIGIVFMGLGLSMIYLANGYHQLAALAFVASLYHALNHACFKGLLFFGAGAVLHNTHTDNLDQLGGLLNRMPWTGFFFLIGALSIASLPPFNGFVSEWLIFQSALQAGQLSSGVLRVMVPIAAGVLALTAALSSAAFVKAFGVAFLGQPRSHHSRHAHEADRSMRIGQAILAVLCLGLGVLPTLVVALLARVSKFLLGSDLPSASAYGWLWLTPISAEKASYSAPIVFLGIALAVLAWFYVYLRLRPERKTAPVPRVPPWDCGFGGLTPRMQYSSASFSMPIQQIFKGLWRTRVESEPVLPSHTLGHAAYQRYVVHSEDLAWHWLYQPVADLMQSAARKVGMLQTGHLRHYLLYSLLTLVLLLWLLR